MSKGVGEWIETTLGQVISFYPQYIKYDLYAWDEKLKEGYFLGEVEQTLETYEHKNVFLTDETNHQIWLEDNIQELGLEE